MLVCARENRPICDGDKTERLVSERRMHMAVVCVVWMGCCARRRDAGVNCDWFGAA